MCMPQAKYRYNILPVVVKEASKAGSRSIGTSKMKGLEIHLVIVIFEDRQGLDEFMHAHGTLRA